MRYRPNTFPVSSPDLERLRQFIGSYENDRKIIKTAEILKLDIAAANPNLLGSPVSQVILQVMADKFLDLMFTPKVLEAQQRYYGRAQNPSADGPDDLLGPDEISFIESHDSFYMSSVSETGWPYVQHRGGPPGFLKVLAPNELAFADYKGNRQMLTTGNLATNDRVCLFLMDYPHRARLKILGHASVLDVNEDPDIVDKAVDNSMRQATERVFRIRVVSYDWNCPKYITPRYTVEEIDEAVLPLRQRIKELESEMEKLQNGQRKSSI